MAATTMRASPQGANGGSIPTRTANGGARKVLGHNKYDTALPSVESNDGAMGYEPPMAKVPRTHSVSYKSPPAGRTTGHQTGRSFSDRARDLPPGNLNYTTRKSAPQMPPDLSEESTTPRGLPKDAYLSEAGMAAQYDEESAMPPAVPTGPSPSSPPTRSSTMRSVTDPQRDWASDRSPLQKLEVTLNGISKEEKRARVQEAEMRLRERLARQKLEREQAATAARTEPEQTTQAGSRVVYAAAGTSERRGISPKDMVQNSPTMPPQRQPGSTAVRQNRAVSMNPQYPAIRRPEDPQYARAEPAVATAERTERRSVTLGGPSTRRGPAGENIAPNRPMSQSGLPPRQVQPALVLREENADEQPAFQSASGSVDSQSKPKKQSVSFNVPPPTPPPIFEWKNAPVAKLKAADFDFQHLDLDRGKAWWEGGGTADRRKSRALSKNYQTPAQKLPGTTEHKNFQHPLFLRCGPLLRYTGIKRVKIDGGHGPADKEIWRGTILIITKDSRSSYSTPPSLRLFSQPMDLLPPPPAEISGEDNVQLAPEYVDPTAGLMKVGRDGRPLYVKPVDHLEEQVDLSFVENDDGIYEMTPSMIDYSNEGLKQTIPSDRIHSVDGETAGVYQNIAGVRLYTDAARDVTFWRFSLEIELGATQQRIAYRISQGPALGFWVPAADQSMNVAFHSGNGLNASVDPNRMCGPDPLWRDILNEHQTRPFHVMIGGGDQIFNDSVITDSPFFQEWLKIKNVSEGHSAPFVPEFRAELEQFYLERYARWFSQGLFSLANSQIPMINIWNDHEIFEGFGSYRADFMQSLVISGLGKIAFKYYLLFQHHSVPEETELDEPSWLLGAQPGPYIDHKSRNLFMSLGHGISFLGLDCRTERTNNEVLTESTCDLVWDRCHREIMKGETKHLIVLSSVPLAYPRVAMLKNFMNSRKSLGKSGRLGALVNRSGSNVEVFDDHWTGKYLKSERTWLVEDLQDLAAEKSVRVTILSGDVHLAAIGQFYSNPKLNISKDRDYRYMPNVIASAIADLPETELISDMLNKRNTVHHMDSNTDEDIIPIFSEDVDGKPRNNKRLLPRRNWCSIREYDPGTTPPDTPESAMTPTKEPRPGMLPRTLSLGRADKRTEERKAGGIFRRLSTRGPPPTRTMSLSHGSSATPDRRSSIGGPFPPTQNGDSYFPPDAAPPPRPTPFHRRPTNLSNKGAKRAALNEDDGVGAYVNLEGGLAITLNLEVNSQDPSGITVPYKLLVPALQLQGNEFGPPPTRVVKRWRKWLNMPRRKKTVDGDASDDEQDDYEDHDLIKNTRANAATANSHYDQQQDEETESGDSHVEQPPEQMRKKWLGVI